MGAAQLRQDLQPGGEGNGCGIADATISGDGRTVAFSGDITSLVPQRGNHPSNGFDMTPDGRTLTFGSEASNLAPGCSWDDFADDDAFVATLGS